MAGILIFSATLSDPLLIGVPTSGGYCPESATCVITADDPAALFQALGRLDVAGGSSGGIGSPVNEWQLAVRKATGIRPTPRRWRLWMGRNALVAMSDTGTGACLRPGVLTRMADVLLRITGQVRIHEGIRERNGYFYAWREGFLLVSPSIAYVQAALIAPPQPLSPADGPESVRIQWTGAHRGELVVQAREGLPIHGQIQAALTHRNRPLTLPDAWPEPPLMLLATTSWGDLQSVTEAILGPLHNWRFLRETTSNWAAQARIQPPHHQWQQAFNECALALTGIDTTRPVPIPETVLVLRSLRPLTGRHPLHGMTEGLAVIPYSWEGQPGSISPLFGEKVSLCLGRHGRDWLAGSRSAALSDLAGRLGSGEPIEADMVLEAHWPRLAPALQSLLLTAATNEMLPGWNTDDVQQHAVPFLENLARQGALRIEGKAERSLLTFSGNLAPSPEISDAG